MRPHTSGAISAPDSRNNRLRVASLLALVLLTASCAKVIGPPGGPEDKTPPTILNAEPHSHQTQIPAGNSFTVEFSENIDPRSVAKQFFVSPRQSAPAKLKVSGAKLTAIFADSFALGPTYVITVGSGLRDLRGNQLGVSQSFAFTRGDEIDTSHIAGTVTEDDSPASGVGVALFREFTPRTIGDMDSLYPDYFTVSGSDGTFELAFLPVDKYFILAFQDKDKNQLFQYGVEDYGLTTKRLRVGSDTYDNLELRMQKTDTAEVTIISATFNQDRLLKVNLSRKITPNVFVGNLEHVRILNAEDSSLIATPSALKDEHGGATKRLVYAFDDFPDGEYLLGIEFAALYSDMRIGEEQIIPLSHSNVSDVSKPQTESRHSQRIIAPWETLRWSYAFSEPIILDSTFLDSNREALQSDSAANLLSITDTRSKSFAYDILLPRSPFELFISAPAKPVMGERYNLTINPLRVIDVSGNQLSDSTLIDSIDVWPSDSLGALTMSIDNRFDSLFAGSYFLKMDRLKDRAYWATTNSSDSIRLELPAGDYIVEIMVDSTSMSVGTLYPLRYAAPRAFFPDTIHIRPRFDTEGIRIIIE